MVSVRVGATRVAALVSFGVMWVWTGTARADIGVPYVIYDADKWPTQAVSRTSTLPEGVLEIGARAGLYAYSIDTPGSFENGDGDGSSVSSAVYSLSPSVHYGITPLLTVGVSQYTTFVTVPDLSDPTVTGATTLDTRVVNFNPDALLRFAGYDVGLHVQVPIHTLTTTSRDGNGDQTTDSSVYADLRVAVEGRISLSTDLACLRFRAGLSKQELVGPRSEISGTEGQVLEQDKVIPDFEATAQYQVRPDLMLGARLGIGPLDLPLAGFDGDAAAFIEAQAQHALSSQLDLTARLATYSPHESGTHLAVVELGLLYRP